MNFSILGECRLNFTRLGYYRPVGQVRIGGTLRAAMIDKRTLTIVDGLHARASTASFECFDFVPTKGQEVIVTLGTTENRIFAGHILNISQRSPTAGQRVRFRVDCVDYTWLLDTRRITGRRYQNESPTTIIADLMSAFAPAGFTVANVEAAMDPVDFTANHAETLMQALNRLMKMASKVGYQGGYCWIDYTKDVHAFVTPETDGNPLALTMGNRSFWGLTYRDGISQARSRVYVMGGVTQTTSAVPNTATAVPVDATDKFASTGGLALSYGNQLAYTGTSPTSGPGWLTGVTSFAYAIPQGESVRVLATRVNSSTAQSIAARLGSGDGLIDHVIEDERLSDAGARTKGDAELARFASEEAVTFSSRDHLLRSGKTLAVSLTAPAVISAQLLVQQVTISEIGVTTLKFPLRTVEAAMFHQDVFDLLAAADRLTTEGTA